MGEMMNLQLAMSLMIIAGIVIKKIGIVGKTGQRNLTDLIVDFILPCSIIKSFMIEFTWKTLYQFGTVLLISMLIQVGCEILGKLLYGRKPAKQRNNLRYALICSNAGFFGNAIAEGIYGNAGLALASIYLIPQRIMMWSSGLTIYSGETDRKAVLKRVLAHPCIISCEIGIAFMLAQVQLPTFLNKALISFTGCLTPLSMMVIGMILADMKIKELVDREIILFAMIRLMFVPSLVWIPCVILRADRLVTGVSVLLAAMPAGAMTSIMAAKYNSDERFATKLIVFSTLCSVVTTMMWSIVLK